MNPTEERHSKKPDNINIANQDPINHVESREQIPHIPPLSKFRKWISWLPVCIYIYFPDIYYKMVVCILLDNKYYLVTSII